MTRPLLSLLALVVVGLTSLGAYKAGVRHGKEISQNEVSAMHYQMDYVLFRQSLRNALVKDMVAIHPAEIIVHKYEGHVMYEAVCEDYEHSISPSDFEYRQEFQRLYKNNPEVWDQVDKWYYSKVLCGVLK